jgi:ring-1,2-phenylacetyl-CoA epoxidase subunit PaaC
VTEPTTELTTKPTSEPTAGPTSGQRDDDASAVAAYTLWLADDALVLAQRLSEWVTRAPELEEDVALANIALDLLGQARTLLAAVGDEDALAFERDERAFRNVLLVELPRGDFAVTIVRQLMFSAYQLALYQRLVTSTDPTLAALAGKAVKEVGYHWDHARQWTLRLGDGTAESHRRAQAAVDQLWPYHHELFASDPMVAELVARGVAVDPAALRDGWLDRLDAVLTQATLRLPDDDGWRPGGGRYGRHTEDFGYLLAEMQALHRQHPGARW